MKYMTFCGGIKGDCASKSIIYIYIYIYIYMLYAWCLSVNGALPTCLSMEIAIILYS